MGMTQISAMADSQLWPLRPVSSRCPPFPVPTPPHLGLEGNPSPSTKAQESALSDQSLQCGADPSEDLEFAQR